MKNRRRSRSIKYSLVLLRSRIKFIVLDSPEVIVGSLKSAFRCWLQRKLHELYCFLVVRKLQPNVELVVSNAVNAFAFVNNIGGIVFQCFKVPPPNLKLFLKWCINWQNFPQIRFPNQNKVNQLIYHLIQWQKQKTGNKVPAVTDCIYNYTLTFHSVSYYYFDKM